MKDITRRDFLIGASALAVLAACRSSKKPSLSHPDSMSAVLADVSARGGVKDLNIFPGGDDFVPNVASYLGVGLIAGQSLVVGKPVTMWAAPLTEGTGAPLGPIIAPFYPYTKPEPAPAPQGVNATTIRFTTAGVWQVYAEVEIDGHIHYNTAAVQVATHSPTRIPGQQAIASQTPTVDDHRGVNPICTRSPMCPFHRVTLARALSIRKPTLFYTGTPKWCQSRTCGPNLDELIAASQTLGDRVSIIHSEVYRADSQEAVTRQLATPTFVQWGFQGEPWLFIIDKTGTILSRFEGPLTASQIRQAVQPILG
ncbi:MAG: TlpA family protein disulfide reductase [Actinomycetota bacterium]